LEDYKCQLCEQERVNVQSECDSQKMIVVAQEKLNEFRAKVRGSVISELPITAADFAVV
jgi:hypothetical protein